ncbi:hypothetical protein LEMLEM_LOCUS1082, partial [Lemmus lemmus]
MHTPDIKVRILYHTPLNFLRQSNSLNLDPAVLTNQAGQSVPWHPHISAFCAGDIALRSSDVFKDD